MENKLDIRHEKFRTYLFIDNVKTKMIPVKYHDLTPDIIFSSIRIKGIRLNGTEKESLDKHLFDYIVSIFIKNIEITEKYVYELIQSAKPIHANLVNVLNQSDRYEIEFDNGVCLTCSVSLYNASIKKLHKFSNF